MATYAEAKERGLAVFNSGSPCSNGHRCGFYVKTGVCIKCSKTYRDDAADRKSPKRKLFRAMLVRKKRALRQSAEGDHARVNVTLNTARAATQLKEAQDKYEAMLGRRPTRSLVLLRALQMCSDILDSLANDPDAIASETERMKAISGASDLSPIPLPTTSIPPKDNITNA